MMYYTSTRTAQTEGKNTVDQEKCKHLTSQLALDEEQRLHFQGSTLYTIEI